MRISGSEMGVDARPLVRPRARKPVFDTDLAAAYVSPSRHISSVTTTRRTND